MSDQGPWYAPPVMVPAVSPMGMGGAGVSGHAATFGAGADGRATYEFSKYLRLDLDAVWQAKKPLSTLMAVMGSKFKAGGPAHTWSARMQQVLPQRYRIFLHHWVREAYDNPQLYAARLLSVDLMLHEHDLRAVDQPRISLHELMRQSMAQYLQQTPWELKSRALGEPPLPGPVPEFMLHSLRRVYGEGALADGFMVQGQEGAGHRPHPPAPRPPAAAAPQPAGAGEGGQAQGEGGDEPGPGDGGGGDGGGPARREPGPGITRLLPLEQVDRHYRPGQLQSTNIPPFAPPLRFPEHQPDADVQQPHPQWYNPATLPDLPRFPEMDEEDADMLEALQEFETEQFNAMRPTDTQCPSAAEYLAQAFDGKFLELQPHELQMLQYPQPDEADTPATLWEKIEALVHIKGGWGKWPMVTVVDSYLKAIELWEGTIAKDVSLYIATQRLDRSKVHPGVLASHAQSLWTETVRRTGKKPRLRQPKQATQPSPGGASRENRSREQRGRQPTQAEWDRDRVDGLHRARVGRVGGYNQGGYGSRAHRAEAVDDGYSHSAHAAQHMEVAPATYSVPPPRHYGQYVGGRGGAGHQQSPEQPCITCGSRKHSTQACWVQDPASAQPWWKGPSSVLLYEAYVRNCVPGRHVPVRFMYSLGGYTFSKDVADYLGKVGDRLPTPPPPPGGGAGPSRPTQHRQSGAGAGGSRAPGRGGKAVAFVAETTTHSYPDLADTFTRGTRLHAEEAEDDADSAYYGCYAESEVSELGEALVSTRRTRAKPTATAGTTPGSQPQQVGAAGASTSAAGGPQPQAVPPIGGHGPVSSNPPAPPGTAVLEGRPPLPPPMAAGKQLPHNPKARQATTTSAKTQAPAESAGGQPAAAPAAAQPAVGSAVPATAAARPRPPLPFTTIQPAEGTPPTSYPTPVPKYRGSPMQQAVARGGFMQQLPVHVSLHDLANSAAVPAEAFKQLLSSAKVELAVVQQGAAQGQLGSGNLMVKFSSFAEAMRLLSQPQQAFAALDREEEKLGQTCANGEGEFAVEPLAQEAAGVAAAEESDDEAAAVAAEVGVGATASTAGAAAGHVAARLQELEGPKAVVTRPSTFELLAQTPSKLGISVTLLDSVTKQETRALTGQIQRFILDSGADVVLMSEDCAKRNMLGLVPSNRRICTSSGHITCTLSKVDQPVQYALGKGTPHECAVVEDTYVMPGSGSTYDVLLGTPLIIKWGLYVDPLTSTATYRPLWHSKGDSSTKAQVPVLTTIQVAAPRGAAQTCKLIEAEPELAKQQHQQPECGAAELELKKAEPGAEPRPQQQQAPAAKAELAAAAEAAAAAKPPHAAAAEPPQASAAQPSGQTSYEPPTSFLILAA